MSRSPTPLVALQRICSQTRDDAVRQLVPYLFSLSICQESQARGRIRSAERLAEHAVVRAGVAEARRPIMHGLIYLIGLIVVILFILSFLGLR
jgi:intracellular sulfur oxidation DsrE/DsrF family protein